MTRNTARSISVVIPVYNGALSLEKLVQELELELSSCSENFEAILVNDGSKDESWQVIERLAKSHSFVRGFNLMRNYGQHNALLSGIRSARNDIVITMDDDLQHPPSEIPKLLGALEGGCDVAYGVPIRQQHGILRDLASQITKLVLQGAMGEENARHISAFRGFRTELRQAFAAYTGPFVSIDVLLTWATTRFTRVEVRHDPRRTGTSNYTVRQLITHATNMVTGFTILPLQFASIVGFGFTILGILLFGFVMYNYVFLRGRVPGFTFIVSAIAIFSGAQLFAIGVIGEYLARIHFRLMDKPPYSIRQRTDDMKGGQSTESSAAAGVRSFGDDRRLHR